MTDPVVGPLVAGLTAEYATRYPGSDVMADATAEQFDPPAGAFVVLVAEGADRTDGTGGGRVVAGGGFRRIDDGTCEVKRMWTATVHRRRGYAGRVLAALEEVAVERGYTRLILETGPAQPEAIAFYERLGYRRIPVYGHYGSAIAFDRALPGRLDCPVAGAPAL